MFRTPARSEIVSPSDVNMSGTPASSPPARTVVQKTSVKISLNRGLPPEERRAERLAETRRQVAAPELAPATQVLDQGHEEKDQPDEDEQEVGRQVGLGGREVAAGREHGVERHEGHDGEGVQPRQEDEGNHGVAICGELVGSNVAPEAEDVGSGRG